MDGMNRVYLMGNLGQDPEGRTSATGKRVVRLSVATRNVRKVDGQYVDNADWHRVTAFDSNGEFLLKYAHKGDQVTLECVLRPRKWTDNDGKVHYDVGIIVEKVLGLHSRNRRDVAQASHPDDVQHEPAIEVDEAPGEEVPF